MFFYKIPIFLLLFLANVNVRDHKNWTPLLKAVALGRTKMIPELLKNGADPYMVDNKGENSFDKAIKFDRFDVLNILNTHTKNANPLYSSSTKIDENELF